MAFHQEHKIFLVARTADAKRKLGRTIAAGLMPVCRRPVALKYMIEAQGYLNVLPRRGRFAHAMERALGMDLALSSPRREEVIRSIHAYRKGHLPRMALLLLLDHLAGSGRRDSTVASTYRTPSLRPQGSSRGCDHACLEHRAPMPSSQAALWAWHDLPKPSFASCQSGSV